MVGAVRRWFLGGVVCALGAGLANAEVIVAYESANPDGDVAASQVAAGINAMELSRGLGVSKASGTTFNTRGWSSETVLDPEDYLQWGWDSSLSAFDLDTLDVRYDRSSSGPAQLEIHVAVNGGPFESILHDQEVDVSGESLLGLDLSRFDAIESATFRLYGYDSSRSSGTFDLENFAMDPNHAIAVRGTASSVPEPGGLAMLLTLGVGTVVTARVRRTRGN